MKSAGALVFSGRLLEPETATVVRIADGDRHDHRRAFRRVQGTPGRLLHHRGRRPRRGARVGVEDHRGGRRPDRGPTVHGDARRLASRRRGVVDAAAIDRIFREESGRCVATLIRIFGDIDVAEDAVQDAFAVALRKWPVDGLPPNPGGWITTTARRCAIDRLRRESRGRDLLDEVAVLASRTEDPGMPEVVSERARRPASPHLHVLQPGAVHGGAGRAHAAVARRADDGARSPARSSCRRVDHGPAPRACQAQDQGGADPVSRAGG